MTTTKEIRRICNKPGRRTQKDVPLWEPTPEEIAAETAKIRSEWTEVEMLRRGRGGARASDAEFGVRLGRICEDEMGEVA